MILFPGRSQLQKRSAPFRHALGLAFQLTTMRLRRRSLGILGDKWRSVQATAHYFKSTSRFQRTPRRLVAKPSPRLETFGFATPIGAATIDARNPNVFTFENACSATVDYDSDRSNPGRFDVVGYGASEEPGVAGQGRPVALTGGRGGYLCRAPAIEQSSKSGAVARSRGERDSGLRYTGHGCRHRTRPACERSPGRTALPQRGRQIPLRLRPFCAERTRPRASLGDSCGDRGDCDVLVACKRPGERVRVRHSWSIQRSHGVERFCGRRPYFPILRGMH